MSDHIHGAGCVGHEVPGYYDGVLYSHCSDGTWRNDWQPGSNRWAKAEAAESRTEPQGVAS